MRRTTLTSCQTKSHSPNDHGMTKRSLSIIPRRVAAAALCALIVAVQAIAQIPDRPMPPAFVNDLAGLLSPAGSERVERELTEFSDSTTSQITVVTVTDLGGYDIADFAQQLGDKWGVGHKGKDNGVVMVVCANAADSTGRAFIASGYGMEGALTDVACARIVRNVMGPLFKAGDHDGAIEAGCRAVMDATRGEFTASGAASPDEWSAGELAAIVIILALILLYFVSSFFIDWYNRAETRQEKITSAMTFLFVLASIYTAVARILIQIAASVGGGRGESSSSKNGGGGSFGGGGGGGSW